MTMWALFNPSIQSLMTQRVSANAQGQLQGGLASLMAMMGIFAPTLYTSLFALGVSKQLPGGIDLPGAPFLTASCFLAIALAISLLAVRRGPGSGKPL
jgi:DHA1 family tetracycline resistance protein-like MFS transporter